MATTIYIKKHDGLYNSNDIQAMLKTLTNRSYRKEFLKHVTHDLTSIIDCIEECWYERFHRYDSDVCEHFIEAYEEWVASKV